MEPERILHMIGSLEMGGSQAMVLNLYRAIDRTKIQFDFIVDHPDRMELEGAMKALGARIFIMPTFVGKNITQVQREWTRFFQEHPEYKVLHSHVRSYASVYLPIARKYGLKTIIHSHSTSNGKGVKAIVKAAMQLPIRFMADYYFSCSKEAGQWLFGKRIVAGARHYVIKNAIDAKAYQMDNEVRTAYIQELKLAGKRVYAHVGRFHPAKNHEFLLRVFHRIKEEQKNAVLMLIGDGDLRPAIESWIRELNIEDDVIMLGNRHDIPKLLQAADVFLFPSLYEGLGIAVVEAQAAGLPCMCSPGVPQLAKVTEHCRYLPLDAETWASEALKEKAARSDTYECIKVAGYDICDTAQWLLEFYLNCSKASA